MDTCALIMGATGSEIQSAFFTLNVSGERALPVFTRADKAEDFRILRGLGPEWSVFDDAGEGLVGPMLRGFVASRIGYVTINPPIALAGEDPPAVALIPIEEFLDQLEDTDER